MPSPSENETIIKRILPYLTRRGYSIDKDMAFEEPTAIGMHDRNGFIDVVLHCGRVVAPMIIEAKRDGTRLTPKHRAQGIGYAKSKKCFLVAITNGQLFELYNAKTGKPMRVNDEALNRIPSREDLLKHVTSQMKANSDCDQLKLPTDRSLPFRPGLPLSKLNHLIKQCHNSIRKIEKNEEHAFSDFSKFLFLKLLEEKWDIGGEKPPYSYTFHELAARPAQEADQVHAAIEKMIEKIRRDANYGDVLDDPIRLKKDASYLSIVKKLSGVSFHDCDLDSKGAAFEYFVRATLKGKKLGQYFTPRPLVRLMLGLGHSEQILASLSANEPFKVLDPACGTGGFLVLAMTTCLEELDTKLRKKQIHPTVAERLRKTIMQDVFHGIDAHEGVACSAKMNMIIAGDGHTNIRCADTLNEQRLIPAYTHNGVRISDGKCHLILTNPPFGTSEAESLSDESALGFEVQSKKGQSLFIQKMIEAAHAGSRIVTVIDEGVLNTASYTDLRSLVLRTCRVEYVVRLPDETFKPNKINVRSSLLVLQRRNSDDTDYSDDYPITFVEVESLGYDGSGQQIRAFDLDTLVSEVCDATPDTLGATKTQRARNWRGFVVQSKLLASDSTNRFDYKYWIPETRAEIARLVAMPRAVSIEALNTIKTRRGKSPSAADYVSAEEGYAFVLKSGSNISKSGELVPDGDFIEEAIFQEYLEKKLVLEDGDVVLASTGDGTLGKCCVFRKNALPSHGGRAVPEGHVTVIRAADNVYPEFLCDYLRVGFGHEQLYRLFTGSTGMVEVTPDDVNRVVVPPPPTLKKQQSLSAKLREAERTHSEAVSAASNVLSRAIVGFEAESKGSR